jgi:hypothetical protein
MADETPTPKPDKAFIAATHGVDEAPHTHPGQVGVSRDEIGRKSDESWKSRKKEKEFEQESALDEVDRETPM